MEKPIFNFLCRDQAKPIYGVPGCNEPYHRYLLSRCDIWVSVSRSRFMVSCDKSYDSGGRGVGVIVIEAGRATFETLNAAERLVWQ